MTKYSDKSNDDEYTKQFSYTEMVAIRKDRIRKGVGTAILSAVVLAGAAGVALECNIDHTEELCPYCAIVGYDHQVNKINRQNDHLHAQYGTRYDLPDGATLVFDEDGNSFAREVGKIKIVEKYEVPKGYKLEKNLNGDWIGVARNSSGEITGIADAKLVKYLEIPDGYIYKDGIAYKDTPISEQDVIEVCDDNQNIINCITLG